MGILKCSVGHFIFVTFLRALRQRCPQTFFFFYLRNGIPKIFLIEIPELEIRPHGHIDGPRVEKVPINYSMAPHHCLLRLHLIYTFYPQMPRDINEILSL